MSHLPTLHRDTIRPKNALVPGAGVVAVLALLLLSVWMCWFFGALSTIRPRPTGQLEADARSLQAAFTYLLDRETDSVFPAATIPICRSNSIAQSAVAASVCSSNQAEFPSESITNGPARS
ncbi:MAG TPA: hypothetical protein VFZ59_08680 [Verrucomicrobiae bacterium]|nr:hypothetical protein [Verrucomicrobiae bacterium]